MDNRAIVGVGFRAGAGKDSVGNIMESYGFVRLRFADALKDAACGIFGWRRDQLEDLDFKQTVDEFWGETPRTLLQRFGTEAMRNNIRQDIWIKALERRIKRQATNVEHSTRIVITDVRFLNEALAIKEWGGKLICIHRPGFDSNVSSKEAKHVSETELVKYYDWDYHLYNDSDLLTLRSAVYEIVRQLGIGELE